MQLQILNEWMCRTYNVPVATSSDEVPYRSVESSKVTVFLHYFRVCTFSVLLACDLLLLAAELLKETTLRKSLGVL